MGQETTVQPIVLSSFRGLNTKRSDISIGDREASRLYNYNLTLDTLEVRNGQSLVIKNPAHHDITKRHYPIVGMKQMVLNGNVVQVFIGGEDVYSFDISGNITRLSPTQTITIGQDNLFDFSFAKDSSTSDIMVMCNGIDPPIKWDGVGNLDVLGGVPENFKHVCWRGNRLWGTYGEFVFHSDLLNAELWDPLFWVARFATNGIETSEITGIAKFGDSLVIFKEKAIFLFSGESFIDGYIQEVVTGDGCISGYSIAEIPSRRYGNILVFVNSYGEIKGFNGTKNLINLSDSIDPTIRTFNKSRAKFISGTNNITSDQYVINASTLGSFKHDRLIGYDYGLDATSLEDGSPESVLTLHNGFGANVLGIMEFSGIRYLMSGTYDGWVVKHSIDDQRDLKLAYKVQSWNFSFGNLVVYLKGTDSSEPAQITAGDLVTLQNTGVVVDGDYTVVSVDKTISPNQVYLTTSIPGSSFGSFGELALYKPIESEWNSKKFAFRNAGHQKSLNDISAVVYSQSAGSIDIKVFGDSTGGSGEIAVEPPAAFYGDSSFYGESVYGDGGTAYWRGYLSGQEGIVGRYLQCSVSNVNGFRFGLEELLLGVTDLGYQNAYVA